MATSDFVPLSIWGIRPPASRSYGWTATCSPVAPKFRSFPKPRGHRQRSGNYPAMPSPGALVPPRLPVEDSYLELLADTPAILAVPAPRPFLQRYIRAIPHLDLRATRYI